MTNQYTVKRDLLLVVALELKAKANAIGSETGIARDAGIVVRYYPRSNRYTWFDAYGPIKKSRAIELLTKDRVVI